VGRGGVDSQPSASRWPTGFIYRFGEALKILSEPHHPAYPKASPRALKKIGRLNRLEWLNGQMNGQGLSLWWRGLHGWRISCFTAGSDFRRQCSASPL